jgi:protein TonB
MAYANEGMSKNRMIAFGLVALLHVFLGYAFITGLALKAVKKLANTVEAVNVEEEAPPPEEPPPPPPKDIEIPPFVPPPEVSVQSDAPTNAITTQSTISRPDPPVVAPPAPPAPPAALPPPAPATPRGRGNVSWQGWANSMRSKFAAGVGKTSKACSLASPRVEISS